MSSTVISVIVSVLVMVLPFVGITLDSAALTNAIQVIVVIASGLVVWYKHVADAGGARNAFGGVRRLTR